MNMTYKLLYNDAVAMTGGQKVDGPLSPQHVARQFHAEGVTPIVLVTDEPETYSASELPPGTTVRHRDELETVQREMREIKGCSGLIFVQTCAAEKRRRRKRGTFPDPAKRVFINPEVCEGCGDCSVQSNCVAVEPFETALGRKRKINQSACNKDFSCLKGFCPSFVTVEGVEPRKASATEIDPNSIPEPLAARALNDAYNIAITGVGGTGVLTIGSILGMAAHIEGKASMILDMAGLAQKGGAVFSYLRLADDPEKITSPRIVTGGADLLLAADAVVAASKDGVILCDKARTQGVVNTHLTPVAGFIKNRDFNFEEALTRDKIARTVENEDGFHDFTALAERALGDAIMGNMMMMGYALQKGLLPVGLHAILQAIGLNGVSVDENIQALHWGRKLAADPLSVSELLGEATTEPIPQTLDEIIEHRAAHLTGYQNKRLAKRYRKLVDTVRTADEDLAESVARNYAKLLSYKDEYEVARLFTDGRFEKRLSEAFNDGGTISFHLAPPFMGGIDAQGRPKKRKFSARMMTGFRLLTKLKALRGTWFDPFGRTEERRAERQLIKDYEADIARALNAPNREAALALAALPDQIRGYGPVKLESMEDAALRRTELLAALDTAPDTAKMAAE